MPTGIHNIKIVTDNETWQQSVTIQNKQTSSLTAKSSYVAPKEESKKDLPNVLYDTRDNKSYKIVEIGSQVWMAENLAYKPSSGNAWAYDNKQSNVSKYGYLYDWETANKVCPSGWHLPSDDEWKKLEISNGMNKSMADKKGWRGNSVIGEKLLSITGWNALHGDDQNGTNSSGFNAKPVGSYSNSDGFKRFESCGWWATFWTASPNGKYYIWYRTFTKNEIHRWAWYKENGYSVRCIKN